MSNKSFIVFSFLALTLAGCIGSMPKTPELLVQNAQGGKMFSKKDSYEVNQPLSKVAAILKEKSAECLQSRLESSHWERGLNRTTAINFTPKMEVTKERARLIVQLKDVSTATVNLGGMPEDGWYAMVVNAYPVDKHKTRVESYFQYSGYDSMHTAVKSWVTGASIGCPDLTQ